MPTIKMNVAYTITGRRNKTCIIVSWKYNLPDFINENICRKE
jgi:hypothetical protein